VHGSGPNLASLEGWLGRDLAAGMGGGLPTGVGGEEARGGEEAAEEEGSTSMARGPSWGEGDLPPWQGGQPLRI